MSVKKKGFEVEKPETVEQLSKEEKKNVLSAEAMYDLAVSVNNTLMEEFIIEFIKPAAMNGKFMVRVPMKSEDPEQDEFDEREEIENLLQDVYGYTIETSCLDEYIDDNFGHIYTEITWK